MAVNKKCKTNQKQIAAKSAVTIIKRKVVSIAVDFNIMAANGENPLHRSSIVGENLFFDFDILYPDVVCRSSLSRGSF